MCLYQILKIHEKFRYRALFDGVMPTFAKVKVQFLNERDR